MDSGMWIAAIGIGLTFLANFGGLVWGASTMSSAIKHLDQTTSKLDKAVTSLERSVGRLDTRVTVLEDKHEPVDP